MQMLVRVTVPDFEAWKELYDGNLDHRREVGMTELFLWRKEGHPEHVFALFEIADRQRAEAWVGRPELRDSLRQVGVVEPLDVAFLNPV